jgi:hypothetical protein
LLKEIALCIGVLKLDGELLCSDKGSFVAGKDLSDVCRWDFLADGIRKFS